MPRGTALTERLDAAKERQLREQIARSMQPAYDDVNAGPVGQYPRMLFSSSYHPAQQEWISNPDPAVKKLAMERMAKAQVIVQDPEEEEEWLRDGWKPSPADFLEIDPRVPVGREARRVNIHNTQARKQRILELRRELASLSGDELKDIMSADPDLVALTREEPTRQPVTRRRKKRRARRASEPVAAAVAAE